MKYTKILILIASVALFSGLATSYVGTAPGVLDMGDVEPGETYEGYFHIITDRQETFLINPSFTAAHNSMLEDENRGRYDFVPEETSEEDISSWVDMQDTYQVDPDSVQVVELDDGGVTRSSQKVDFAVTIPEDAEPGYHTGAININPRITDSAGGTASVQTMGISQFVFVFEVKRDNPPTVAKRDLKILGVNGIREGEDKVRVDFLMSNNGTVTTTVQGADTTIYDEFGNETGNIVVGGSKLAPGETKVVETFWSDTDIKAGNYRVEGDVNYLTGQAYIDDAINVSEVIQFQSDPETSEEEQNIPPWLILMVLVLIGSLMYYLDLDPVWIVLLLGVAGISFYVIMAGLPNYLIGVLLLVSVIVLQLS